MTNLEKDSQDACAVALKGYGFVPRRRGILLQPRFGSDATGWLGLNMATWGLPEKVQINPVVGVRHVPLEKALVALAGWRAPIACVSRPLGYLMPQNSFMQWDFFASGDLATIANDMAKDVAAYGQPFIDEWVDWRKFSKDAEGAELLLDNQKLFVLPLVAAINGERSSAEALIRQELERIGDAEDMYSLSYRDFAQKFFLRFAGS